MANDPHKNLTGVDLHECKGASTAAINTVRVSDGAGSGTWQKITSSQTDGTFQAGKILIAYQDASASSNIIFTNGVVYNGLTTVFDSTYNEYEVHIQNMICATDSQAFYLRFGTGGGPSFQASNYQTGLFETGGATALTASTEIRLTRDAGAASLGNASGECLNGLISIYGPSGSTMKHIKASLTYSRADETMTAVVGGAQWTTTTAITSLLFFMSSGNITSGRFTLYGIRKT